MNDPVSVAADFLSGSSLWDSQIIDIHKKPRAATGLPLQEGIIHVNNEIKIYLNAVDWDTITG